MCLVDKFGKNIKVKKSSLSFGELNMVKLRSQEANLDSQNWYLQSQSSRCFPSVRLASRSLRCLQFCHKCPPSRLCSKHNPNEHSP